MIYELCRLTTQAVNLAALAKQCRQWPHQGPGDSKLLGLWQSEIGDLFQIVALRVYPDIQQQYAARQQMLRDASPFGTDVQLTYESFEKFPFLPEATPFPQGKVFEMRRYLLHPGGLQPTLNGWQQALEPAAEYTQHLVINMYALDGPPRIVHLWAFDSLEQRADLRQSHNARGIWPPPGGPQQIAQASNAILLPLY